MIERAYKHFPRTKEESREVLFRSRRLSIDYDEPPVFAFVSIKRARNAHSQKSSPETPEEFGKSKVKKFKA